ncbi:SAM-dependent methyltransferase [candidate division KSB1 bacterium]|nr:SAM-dependent methyltransferase [candidate division KSB1 bacterium]
MFIINYLNRQPLNIPGRKIHSNQNGVHENLSRILERNKHNKYLKPFARHTLEAFKKAEQIIGRENKPLILDSGCGVGESTLYFAKKYKHHFVLGIDKSFHRLNKNIYYKKSETDNYYLLRADLIDFWRLAALEKWNIDKHFVLYPNPWPLKKDLKKRFHAHPVFPDFIGLGAKIELRSNWPVYLQEFAFAYSFFSGRHFTVDTFIPKITITPFERKYVQSGQILYRLVIDNNKYASV